MTKPQQRLDDKFGFDEDDSDKWCGRLRLIYVCLTHSRQAIEWRFFVV
jgi:hypothetical protein